MTKLSVAKKQKAASSGRVCEWQSKVKSDARKDLGRSNTHKNLNDPQLPTSESPLPYEFGGLVDEDADAVAPPFDMTGKDRNPKCINEVATHAEILIISSLLIRISSSNLLAAARKTQSTWESRVESLPVKIIKKWLRLVPCWTRNPQRQQPNILFQ